MPRCYVVKKQPSTIPVQHKPKQQLRESKINDGASNNTNTNYVWNKTVLHNPQSLSKQTKDEAVGPVSPNEACVAPIYYTNTIENRNGKLNFD